MRRRLLLFGLLAASSQLASGCFPVARCAIAKFRANHPCLTCSPAYRAPVHGPVVGGPVVGGPVGDCPGCGAGGPIEGYPVAFAGPPGVPVGPAGGVPGITGPYPLQGPMIETAPGGASPLPMPNKDAKGGN